MGISLGASQPDQETGRAIKVDVKSESLLAEIWKSHLLDGPHSAFAECFAPPESSVVTRLVAENFMQSLRFVTVGHSLSCMVRYPPFVFAIRGSLE